MTETTTARTHHLDLPDGRTYAVDDRGPEDGPVVVLLPSAPGSRLIDPDPAATAAAGIRLLTVDRPGYGDSSPLADGVIPTVAAGADDVAAALALLGVDDAAIVGWSSGGRYALGLAARHPQVVRALALVGTPAPDEDVPWVQDEHRGAMAAMKQDPSGAVAMVAAAFAPVATQPELFVRQVTDAPADEAVLQDPAIAARVQAMVAEGFRPGVLGVATDIVACNVAEPGFDPAAVGAPVALFYGDADVAVPPEHGTWWHGVLGDSDLHVVPGAGHLLALTAWADIVAAVA